MANRFMVRVLPAFVLLAAAACSNPAGSDGGVASAGGATSTPAAGRYADPNARIDRHGWVVCLRQHGVHVDEVAVDPKSNPDGKPRIQDDTPAQKATLNAAAEACRKYNPNWGLPAPPGYDADSIELQRKFAQCMRTHGVDMPDPNPNPQGSEAPQESGPTPGGPLFDAALRTCAREVPGVVTDPDSGPTKTS